jgi:hypothetical protein
MLLFLHAWEIEEKDENLSIASFGLRLKPGTLKIQITQSDAHSTQ